MARTINATEKDFSEIVIKSNVPVLVDFWAPWCSPCLAMAPILDELSDDFAEKAKIVKVDVENSLNRGLVGEYQIRSIPNMKLFVGGKVVQEFVGMREKEELHAGIEAFIK